MLRQFPDAGGEVVRTTFLIARREFVTRVRSRFFIIGTLVFMLLLAGYIVLQAKVFNQSTTTVKVGFTASAQALAAPVTVAGKASALQIEAHTVPDIATGESEVRAGTLDVLVSGDSSAPDVAVKDTINPTLAATLTGLVQEKALNTALTSAGVDPSSIEAKVAAADIHLVFLDPNASQRAQREVVGIFVAALLYVTLLIYGQLVAAGVVEEKQNRIIEILLSTVRPRRLLLGKVLGIGLVGFVQLLAVGAVALIAVAKTQVLSVPAVGVDAVAWGLFWFVLGYVFYALIYAAGGSMVSRQEDIAPVTTPITLLIVGTYLAYFWVVANPDNPIAIGLSLLPPFAPVLIPARIATGDAQAWQIVVAVVLILAGIFAVNSLAARIYSNSVLRVGSRVKLLEAWRGAK